MASLQELSMHDHYFSHHHHHHPHNKITKVPRGGKMVKPLLKKLASSPKNSLDLDRGWEEQPVDFGGYASSTYEAGRPSMSRSVRDVSFQFPSTWEPSVYGSGRHGGVGAGVGAGAGGLSRGGSAGDSGTATAVLVGAGGFESTCPSIRGGEVSGVTGGRSLSRPGGGRYNHVRTASGTSHVSVSTTASSHRPGASFVHPFQQTPRTNTPPLTCAHSFTSFDRDSNPARDYSPTIITENDDDDDFYAVNNPACSPLLAHSAASARSHHLHHQSTPSNNSIHCASASNLRQPALASQRMSSLSELRALETSSNGPSNPPSLRLNTTTCTTSSSSSSSSSSIPRSVPSAYAKLAHGPLSSPASCSASDVALHNNNNNASPATDSPRASLQLASPSSTAHNSNNTTPMSPLRTSLEGAFRLRSRSSVEAGAGRVDIREARRRFEEDERAKQEKYEAEQRRKQARRLDRDNKALRRNNTGGKGGDSMSSAVLLGARPSCSRRRTPPLLGGAAARRTRSGESSAAAAAAAAALMSEKAAASQPASAAFLSSNYESTEGGAAPDFGLDVHDVRFETPQRAHTAKRKTQSYWTSFVLWFRTRLLRLGRH